MPTGILQKNGQLVCFCGSVRETWALMWNHVVDVHGHQVAAELGIVNPNSVSAGAIGEAHHVFTSGAKRSGLKPRYDLIPTSPLRRVAQRYAMGAEKYGDYNWQKGLPLSDTINHIVDHLLRYRDRIVELQRASEQGEFPKDVLQKKIMEMVGTSEEGDNQPDDDLAGAAWGCLALMWLEENGRLL